MMLPSTRPPRAHARTFTFRLDEDIIQKLRLEAEKEGASVNSVANRALRKDVEWDSVSDKLRLMSVSPTLLTKLMTWVPDEQVRELGKWQWTQEWSTFARSYDSGPGIEAGIRTLEAFAQHAKRFHFDRTKDDSKQVLTVFHGMGKKWSLFYEGILEGMLNEGFHDEAKWSKLTSSDNQVVVELLRGPFKDSKSSKRHWAITRLRSRSTGG